MSPRKASVSLSATLYKVGWIRLSAGAASALGQRVVDESYFSQPCAERPLLGVSLHWDHAASQLTLRGDGGPFKMHVYHRPASPLFLIIAGTFIRSQRGLWVPSSLRFPLVEIAERTLVLDRGGEFVRVKRPRSRRKRR